MSRLRDSDFPALGTDTPAEQLIGIRFRWYATQARRARIWYRALGSVQLLAALVIAISVAIKAPLWPAPAQGRPVRAGRRAGAAARRAGGGDQPRRDRGLGGRLEVAEYLKVSVGSVKVPA